MTILVFVPEKHPPGADLKSTFTAMDSRTNTIVWQKQEARTETRLFVARFL
jgi:hypothetical protein